MFASLRLLPILAVAIATPAIAQPAVSVESAIQITLAHQGDAEKRAIAYECDTLDPVTVDYINAAPNFLAIMPIEGQTLILTAVISASGVRYASGKWEWWTSGPEASLYDLTGGPEAEPVASCFEITLTP